MTRILLPPGVLVVGFVLAGWVLPRLGVPA
jgi:hypothetical protein